MNGGTLLQLIVVFGSLSLLSFGGTNTVLPEMHRQAVSVQHWLTDLQFASIFAISQASPGPSRLIVSLVGLKAAGWLGALVATVAMFTPSALVTFAASVATALFGTVNPLTFSCSTASIPSQWKSDHSVRICLPQSGSPTNSSES